MYEYNWYVICGAIPPRVCRQHPVNPDPTPDPQHKIDELGTAAIYAERAGNRRLKAKLEQEIRHIREVEVPLYWQNWLNWVESLPKHKNASCYD